MADINGTKGANFTFTISAATIVNAILRVPGQPNQSLTICGTGRELTVPNLPAGNSSVRLDLAWAPGDPDATVDVGTVTSGTVNKALGPVVLPAGDTPGIVELFGKVEL